MSDYDTYGRYGTSDQGSPAPAGAPAAGLGYASPLYIARVTQAAGAGTALDIQIPVPVKGRVVDAFVLVTTGVASSVVQLFTAAAGGGSAASSSMSTASAAKVRDALTTASQVFAKDSTIFARVSGGATLAAFDLHVLICPEQ